MIIAVDCETTLIAPRETIVKGNQRVKVEPYVVPDCVCVSFADGVSYAPLFAAMDGCVEVAENLRAGNSLVFHNTAFDIPVLCKAYPILRPLFNQALEEGRIHDTMILDILIRMRDGVFDKASPPTWARPTVSPRPLDVLAREYCDLHLDKGDDVRLTFGQYKDDFDSMSPKHRHYALQDAHATLKVWEKMLRERRAGRLCRNEAIQLRAAICFAEMDERGVAVDRAEATKLKELFEEDLGPLQEKLVESGLARWVPEPGTVRRQKAIHGLYRPCPWVREDTRMLRVTRFKQHDRVEFADPKFTIPQEGLRNRLIEAIVPRLTSSPRLTETGLLSLKADDWKEHVRSTEPDLEAWLEYERLKKILSTYLDLYSRTDVVYPRWNLLGARSGRTSTSGPNVQNVPKRKHGIRSLFVPRPGHIFYKADYSFQELVTLVEVMLDMGIDGPMRAAIADGDPHRIAAGMLADKTPEQVTKKERQGAKALNFGIPGGLGPAKLADYAHKTYGVTWTPTEAKARRLVYLAKFWDVAQYLDRLSTSFGKGLIRASGNGLRYWRGRMAAETTWDLKRKMAASPSQGVRKVLYEAERQLTVTLPTGRVRGGCRFTEGANTLFQGLAADVTKQAMWEARRNGVCVVLMVHDELVAEFDLKAGGSATAAVLGLKAAMLHAFRQICPRVGHLAKVEVEGPLDRWGPATDQFGKEL